MTFPDPRLVDAAVVERVRGASFSGDWMFVNIQTPGVTFAITGPWQNGPLG